MVDRETKPVLLEYAPAKLNLYLHITGRLLNGYHSLESLAVFLDLKDRLRLVPDKAFNLSISSVCNWHLETENNLIIQAAKKMAALFDRPLDFSLELEKHIPIAAGLGGGSADAAATIRLLARHWALDCKQPEVLELAKSLGADVPVCLYSQPAVMTGIGDKLWFYTVPDMYFVLMNPNKSVSTKAIFEDLGFQPGELRPSESKTIISADRTDRDLTSLLEETRNDMQSAAIRFEPEIARCLSALNACQQSALTRMTGSGATCFSLVSSAKAAENNRETLADRFTDDWLWSGGLFEPERQI